MAVRHGLWVSEIGALDIDAIDTDNWHVLAKRLKDSKRCNQPMMDDEIRAMKSWLRERDRTKHPDSGRILFPSMRGTRLGRTRLHGIMQQYGEEAGIPKSKCHFHTLKHRTATLMLEKGSDIRFVQKWLGHANIENTAIYADLTPIAIDEQAKRVFASMRKYY